MRERDVESYLKTNIERIGGMCLKFVSPGKSGVPDRICLLPNGRQFFVELKAPGKKLTALQRKVKKQFMQLGHTVFVADCKKEVDEIIDYVTGRWPE
ncbi:hypothetical protein BTO30_12390 [Domibacillus antri]|uniref:VRR-NUC domain-containing protein n=1 Tax=Domibacillus antri TaxID=1714264 RepID=A0A1Q8Q3G8_9BACI|nr:VRR-NUC domain-containing protein [Domibacillus antri]OLN21890.1 hypothetical protein BTO30_12390 [Domibacillus antri]